MRVETLLRYLILQLVALSLLHWIGEILVIGFGAPRDGLIAKFYLDFERNIPTMVSSGLLLGCAFCAYAIGSPLRLKELKIGYAWYAVCGGFAFLAADEDRRGLVSREQFERVLAAMDTLGELQDPARMRAVEAAFLAPFFDGCGGFVTRPQFKELMALLQGAAARADDEGEAAAVGGGSNGPAAAARARTRTPPAPGRPSSSG